jgi:hypothetical protein
MTENRHEYMINSRYYFNTRYLHATSDLLIEKDAYIWSNLSSYTMTYDESVHTGRQHLTSDFSLAATYEFFNIGINMMPALYLNRQGEDPGYGVASLSAGPLITTSLFTIPVEAKGGYTFDIWSNAIESNWFKSPFDSTVYDDGIYFSFQAGDTAAALFPEFPLYGEGEILGRYMESQVNTKITSGEALLQYRNTGLIRADSIRVVFSDTLVHGRVGNVYGFSGNLETLPMRVDNTTHLTGTLQRIPLWEGSFIPPPDVSISLLHDSYHYPYAQQYASRRERSVVPEIHFENDTTAPISWETDFGIEYEYRDYVYRDEEQHQENYDTLQEQFSIRDYEIFAPYYEVLLDIDLSEKSRVQHKFRIAREKKEYPNKYDAASYDMDSDKQFIRNIFRFEQAFSKRIQAGISANVFREKNYYQMPEQSRNSYIRKLFYVGMDSEFQLRDDLLITAEIGARVEPRYNIFSDSTHRRNFSVSGLIAKTLPNPEFSLKNRTTINYYDRGNLTDRIYEVQDRNNEIRSDVTASYERNSSLAVHAGIEGRHSNFYNWDYDQFQYTKNLSNTTVIPHISTVFLTLPDHIITGELKRYIYIDGTGSGRKWDMHLGIQKELQ